MSSTTHVVALPRLNTDPINLQLKQARHELMTDAATKLGYRAANTTTLLFTLISLGIAPFKPEAVEVYKKSKEHTTMYSGTKGLIVAWTVDFAILLGAVYTAIHHYVGTALCLLMPIVLISLSLMTFTFSENDSILGTGKRQVWSWQSVPLHGYSGVIPDHALSLALEIKKACPIAEFRVEYLTASTELVDPDPFLLVHLLNTNEFYYIEQWDERDLPKLDI